MGLLDRVFKKGEEGRASGGGPASPSSPGGPSSTPPAPYDEVIAPGPDGELKRMSKREFESLPLENRVRLLVQGTLRFSRNGQEIPPSEAMRSAY